MMRAEILDIRVLRHLRMATTSLTSAQIADLVYADDPNGGPVTADAAVRLSIGRLVLEGHRIVSKTGRAGGYVYVGYDDPAKITIKTIRERRGQVKVLSDMGLTISRIAGRLGLPTTSVEADLADLERGHDFERFSRIQLRRTA